MANFLFCFTTLTKYNNNLIARGSKNMSFGALRLGISIIVFIDFHSEEQCSFIFYRKFYLTIWLVQKFLRDTGLCKDHVNHVDHVDHVDYVKN